MPAITRHEAIRRLEELVRDASALKSAIEKGWVHEVIPDSTAEFLGKCAGWEDTKTPEEIVAEVYAARTASGNGGDAFIEVQ